MSAALDLQPDTRLDADEPDQAGCGRMRGWCVVHTHPQAERWADANLQRAGYGTYLPLYATRRRDRALPSISHTVLVPLFPGYLFVGMSRGDPWTPIRYAAGVQRLLMAGGNPEIVAEDEISALQAGEAVRAATPPARPLIAAHSAVVVTAGILSGHPGVVFSLRRDQATVGVVFLGELRRIVLPVEFLAVR